MTAAEHTSPPGRAVPLGEIVGTHGVRGLLRFRPYDPSSDDPTAPRAVRLTPRTGGAPPLTKQLLSTHAHGRVRLLRFADVDSIVAAEPLVGTVLAVDERELAPPAPGEFFVYQLEGLEVVTVGGERLGTVARVFPTGSNEVLEVRDGAREHLIPLIADVVKEVDVAGGRVVIEPLPGLLD